MRRLVPPPVALMTSGIFILQLAWAFAVPAYGGIDEIDHAYRAASVADGHWAPTIRETPFGRGTLIRVPDDIVEAANDRCARLPYTERDNCLPVGDADADGNVLVASAASRYNPVFYWIVGTVARPFHGTGALYAMRIATAALCTLLIGSAFWVANRFARSLWPTVGILVALTPVLLYATTVAAPNGVQMAAGVLLWCGALALCAPGSRGSEGPILVLIGVALSVVLATHTTGPMMAALTVGVLVLLNPRLVSRLWREHRRRCVVLVACVATVSIASVGWTAIMKPNVARGDAGDFGSPTVSDALYAMALWILQSIGAVPFRNDLVPVAVFGISLVTFVGFLAGATVAARRRQRIGLVSIAVLTLAVPLILTIATFRDLGLAWQGRYTLPFAVGLPLLAAAVLDGRDQHISRFRVMIPILITAFLLAQGIAVVGVVQRQTDYWPDAGVGAPPLAAMVGATAISVAFLSAGTRLATRRIAAERAAEPSGVEH